MTKRRPASEGRRPLASSGLAGRKGGRDDPKVQAASDRAVTTTQVPSLVLLIRWRGQT